LRPGTGRFGHRAATSTPADLSRILLANNESGSAHPTEAYLLGAFGADNAAPLPHPVAVTAFG